MEKDVPPFFQEKFALDRFVDKRWLSAAAAFLAGIAVLIVYFQSGPKAPAFARAELLFAKWAAGPEDESLFAEMSKAFKRLPGLQEKYEPAIAQKLIEGGKGAEALQIAYRAIEHARADIPYHATFAETTLLIEKGDFQRALERSARLKERMAEECDVASFWGERLVGGSLLYAHNLLRIACLQQELHNRPGEMAAWVELEEFIRKNENGPTSQLLLSSFQEKNLDLSHYIAERKSLLK